MKKLLLISLSICSLSVFSADNIITPKTRGTPPQVLDNAGRVWPSMILYTTDGMGNVSPISGAPTTAALTDAQLRASAVPVSISGVSQAAELITSSTSGTIASGAKEVEFIASTGPVTVLGVTLATGEKVSFRAHDGGTLGAIAYNGTGGVLKISDVR